MQLFEKTQCFYIATVNFTVSVYYYATYVKLTRVFVKRQLEISKDSWKDSGGKSRGLHCDYRQKNNSYCIQTRRWRNHVFDNCVPSCPWQHIPVFH